MIKISDFNYNLPDERIAKFPVAERDHSKLLIYNKGNISEDTFFNIGNYLPEGALMVFNNTRVIRARMHFRKDTGAQIEIFLLEPYVPADYEQMFQTRGKCQWLCLVGNKKKWKEGELSLTLNTKPAPPVSAATVSEEPSSGGSNITLTARYIAPHATAHIVEFSWQSSPLPMEGVGEVCFAEIVDLAGELPIPPYLNRDTESSDLTTYQTVYSKIKGSVAAPTAGLHFTPNVLSNIDSRGIERDEVTLHVGAGTFKPVKTEDVADHEMHAEHFAVKLSTIQNLIRHDAKAVAVGTTSVRTLESLYYIGAQLIRNAECRTQNAESGCAPNNSEFCIQKSALEFSVSQWEPYQEGANSASALDSLKAIEKYLLDNNLNTLHASTQIIITPAGYDYKIVRMLVTNFHQPKSTLLLLVSALIGDSWHEVYDYALAHDFRFLSYGDSSLLIP